MNRITDRQISVLPESLLSGTSSDLMRLEGLNSSRSSGSEASSSEFCRTDVRVALW